MKFVPKTVTRNVCKKVLTVKKNSPHILFVGGVVGVVGSVVLACRATLKLEEKLDEIKKDLDATKADVALVHHDSLAVAEKEHAKAVGAVSIRSAVVIGRLYGPAIVLGGVSIAALTGSHIQLSKRNAALTSTLTLVSKAYDDYRNRVREEVGKEKELDIYHGVKLEEREIDGKNKLVKVGDPNAISIYARFFDEGCIGWQKNPEMNRIFLQAQQNWATNKLQSRGYLLLNEVYEQLGIEHSKAGCIVGWILNEDGDNYVDFGMFEPTNTRFINGYEYNILLDFNVDGVIYHKLADVTVYDQLRRGQ